MPGQWRDVSENSAIIVHIYIIGRLANYSSLQLLFLHRYVRSRARCHIRVCLESFALWNCSARFVHFALLQICIRVLPRPRRWCKIHTGPSIPLSPGDNDPSAGPARLVGVVGAWAYALAQHRRGHLAPARVRYVRPPIAQYGGCPIIVIAGTRCDNFASAAVAGAELGEVVLRFHLHVVETRAWGQRLLHLVAGLVELHSGRLLQMYGHHLRVVGRWARITQPLLGDFHRFTRRFRESS